MIKINLRDLYPFYKSNFYVEVTDEVAELIKQIDLKEHADYERIRVHKAYYSLDAGNGIEKDIVLLVLSPEEIYERAGLLTPSILAISALLIPRKKCA